MESNDEWLAQYTEEPLDPELPICDPHHHLWEHRGDVPANRYLLDDILADIGGGPDGGHNIVSTVYIECGVMYRPDGPDALKPLGETEFANEVAAESASGRHGPTRVNAGIVGHVDLLLGDEVALVLDAHLAIAPERFRGIRHTVPWDASDEVPVMRGKRRPHLMGEEPFRKGFAHLARFGLSFEAWLYHPQLPDAIDLARAFPETTIILNHFGGPLGVGPYAGKRDEIFSQWQKNIAELAACPNVKAKLGGTAMAINGFGWHERPKPPTSEELLAATRPYYEYTLEKFGVERCMFESNFPVDRLSCDYTVLWNSFKRLAADYSADEKAALFHDTAVRVYRLG